MAVHLPSATAFVLDSLNGCEHKAVVCTIQKYIAANFRLLTLKPVRLDVIGQQGPAECGIHVLHNISILVKSDVSVHLKELTAPFSTSAFRMRILKSSYEKSVEWTRQRNPRKAPSKVKLSG